MSTPIKRKLSTILSADVAGYSQLMGADEEGTLRLLAAHRAIIDSIIDLHDGRVVNTAGDSVLAEFTSPVEAVRAATEIQDALKTRNESLPENRRMVFRIGVNIGDVMIKGDDLLGDGVNVAARLQTLAEPGGICISGSVFDQIEGKLSLRFQDIGEQTLKNIARPVRALHLRGQVAPAAAPTPARPPRPPRAPRGMIAALVAAGLIVLAGGAYVGGLVPRRGDREAAETASRASERERAEAELARVKAEAETARVKAEAEAARVKAETETARVKAETETARARAETDLARMRAEAEQRRAAEERAAAARARTGAEAPRTRADTAELAKAPREPASATALPQRAAAVTAPGGHASRFDGLWVGEVSCAEWRGRPAIQRPKRIVVRDGEMRMSLWQPAPPGTFESIGKVRDDDSIELRGTATILNGRTLDHLVTGRFAGGTFTGESAPPGRPCSLQLSRETRARPGG